jgi:hypothetical protein
MRLVRSLHGRNEWHQPLHILKVQMRLLMFSCMSRPLTAMDSLKLPSQSNGVLQAKYCISLLVLQHFPGKLRRYLGISFQHYFDPGEAHRIQVDVTAPS